MATRRHWRHGIASRAAYCVEKKLKVFGPAGVAPHPASHVVAQPVPHAQGPVVLRAVQHPVVAGRQACKGGWQTGTKREWSCHDAWMLERWKQADLGSKASSLWEHLDASHGAANVTMHDPCTGNIRLPAKYATYLLQP
jgi:hypothetical protein